MRTGFRGTFAISWDQAELDGHRCAALASLRVGQSWRWTGEPLRLDGPAGIFPLGDAIGVTTLRQRSARAVRHLLTAVEADVERFDRSSGEQPIRDAGFTVTDGRASWEIVLNPAGPGRPPLAVFPAGLPPRHKDLWVVQISDRPPADLPEKASARGMICFTPGTLIRTEAGLSRIEDLQEGCRIQTKDNGCQEVLWIGQRRISGARLRAMPHLAPVRFACGALGGGGADHDLLVSPDHRVLLRGQRALALFNAAEVLVTARDLINDHSVRVARNLPDVTYLHLLLPAHEIIFANGIETESFHLASADPVEMDLCDIAAIEERLPGCLADPDQTGGPVRRLLGPADAAILRFDQS
jgi:hypothetical protein